MKGEIREIYAVLATRQGAERVCTVSFKNPDTGRKETRQLLASDPDSLHFLRKTAQRIAEEFGDQVEIVRFVVREPVAAFGVRQVRH